MLFFYRSIPDTDAVIDFSQLYEDDQEKIFLWKF